MTYPHALHPGHGPEWPECPECPHGLECLDTPRTQQGRREVDQRHLQAVSLIGVSAKLMVMLEMLGNYLVLIASCKF